MKNLLPLILVFIAFNSFAQKGVELKLNFGHSDVGNERWLATGHFSASALYNVNGTVAIGPFYATGLGAKYNYIFGEELKIGSSFSEIGVNAQFTFARVSKFKFYNKLSFSSIKSGNDIDPDIDTNTNLKLSGIDDNTTAIGVGVGVMLNLGSGLYINLIDIGFKKIKSDFMGLDKTLMRQYQFGIAYNFGGGD